MLQQTQVKQGGNNTNTYNPQKTQAIDQGAAKNEQQAAAFNQETLSSEFDTTPQLDVFSSTDALAYIAVLVVLPILILYYRIYIRFKK